MCEEARLQDPAASVRGVGGRGVLALASVHDDAAADPAAAESLAVPDGPDPAPGARSVPDAGSHRPDRTAAGTGTRAAVAKKP